MRPITQEEAEKMRAVLKEIASFYNPASENTGSQAAARRARAVLEETRLFYQSDAAPQ